MDVSMAMCPVCDDFIPSDEMKRHNQVCHSTQQQQQPQPDEDDEFQVELEDLENIIR